MLKGGTRTNKDTTVIMHLPFSGLILLGLVLGSVLLMVLGIVVIILVVRQPRRAAVQPSPAPTGSGGVSAASRIGSHSRETVATQQAHRNEATRPETDVTSARHPTAEPINPLMGSTQGKDSASLRSVSAPSIEELQREFPELEIISLVGVGGMGAVYRVHRRADGVVLALKVVARHSEQTPDLAARFLREVAVLRRLDHPAIVAVRAHGTTERWCWLAMDLIEGANLRQVMGTGRLSPDQSLALVPPLCNALHYAHGQGVVHRDLKPENILIDLAGQPHLVDFGLAKLQNPPDGEALTVSGAVLGTMHYMAPEQVERSRLVDHRADIYALGVVLYELLTGRLPLGRFEPPSQRALLDQRLDDLVLKALERDPERRWQSALQVTQALDAFRKDAASTHADTFKAVPESAAPSGDTLREQPIRSDVPRHSPVDIRIWGCNESTFCVLIHLSVFAGYIVPLGGFVLPVIMWLVGSSTSQRVDRHGRVVMNWILSHLIYVLILFPLCLIFLGIPFAVLLALCGVIFPIVGAVRAAEGVLWPYPLSIPFLSIHTDSRYYRFAKGTVLAMGCLLLIGMVVLIILVVPVLLVQHTSIIVHAVGPQWH